MDNQVEDVTEEQSRKAFDEARESIKSMKDSINHLAELVIFSAAYNFGYRAAMGEDVSEEVESFKAVMSDKHNI